MKVDSEVKAAISEIQSSLIAAQSAALASLAEREELFRELQELRKQLEARDEWTSTRAKFVTFETRLAFAYKSEAFEGLYCPKCFENMKLSRLQEHRYHNGAHTGECLQCGTELRFEKGATPQVKRGGNWMV
ncbi:MAG: hypothetical protein IE921_06495 [Rhodobacteraceae bacterium]|nr:hypothetical protein [Paracoccaceae bacterium]